MWQRSEFDMKCLKYAAAIIAGMVSSGFSCELLEGFADPDQVAGSAAVMTIDDHALSDRAVEKRRAVSNATPTADYAVWHTITMDFEGPEGSEDDPATFLDYRLEVAFRHGDRRVVVPGFFAADGDAGRTHATAGNIWRVRFTPDAVGTWSYQATMVRGHRVAVNGEDGVPVELTASSGGFTVWPSPVPPESRDFRSKGRLEYVGERYLRFAGTNQPFLKGGAGSPENLLGYYGFDGTFDAGGTRYPSLGEDQLHHFAPHRRDYRPGDPNWTDEDGDDGRNIVGYANYIADAGLNSQYIVTMTYEGDGWEVWPWTHFDKRETFDVSRLAQWEMLFTHMQRRGIMLHLLLTETENESLFEILDGGSFAHTRRLYYREMVARFGHHLALVWNLGEENGHTDENRRFGRGTTPEQMIAFATAIRELDPYDHPIVVHHYPFEQDKVFGPLIGHPQFEGPSLQIDGPYLKERGLDYNGEVRRWIEASADAGRPWVVSIDEPLGWEFGLVPDENAGGQGVSQDDARRYVLWGTLMAGGAGVEWYFGWKDNSPTSDLGTEDMRSRAAMWAVTRTARRFFEEHVPFDRMTAANHLLASGSGYVLAEPGQTYLVYLPHGGAERLDLQGVDGRFKVEWFNPRAGGELQRGEIASIDGGGRRDLGEPPSDVESDWAVLISRTADLNSRP